jgi:exopolysaccharide biosynthesis polyprenyl glycosylphosphotransferase
MFAPKGLTSRWALLIAGDVVLAIVAAYFGRVMALPANTHFPESNTFAFAVGVIALLWVISFYLSDLYRLDGPRSNLATLASLLIALACMGLLVSASALMFPILNLGRRFYLANLSAAIFLVSGWRLMTANVIGKWQSVGVLVLGNEAHHELIGTEIDRRQHIGYKLLADEREAASAMIAAAARPGRPMLSLAPAMGVVESFAARDDVKVLVIGLEGRSLPIAPRELLRWRLHGTEVVSVLTFYERLAGKLPLKFVDELSLVFSPTLLHSNWRLKVKRMSDIATALLIGLVTLPIAILTAIAIKLTSRGPILYSQLRVGMHGGTFAVHKFRSMRVDAETATGAVWAVRGDSRVTRVGRFIRRFRIDELPQLLNVLTGDMSLIGPRPERPEIANRLALHNHLYDHRHCMRPGITGWAQVCYPYGASIADSMEKLAYDLYYVRNWSLTLDLQVLLQTVKVVLLGRGGR